MSKILKQGKAAIGTVLSKDKVYDSNLECDFWKYLIRIQSEEDNEYTTYYTDTTPLLPKNLIIRYFPEAPRKIDIEILRLKDNVSDEDNSQLLAYINDININYKLNYDTGVFAKAKIQRFTEQNYRIDNGNKNVAELVVKVFPKHQQSFDAIMKIVFDSYETSFYKEGKQIYIKYDPNIKSIVSLDYNHNLKRRKIKLLIWMISLIILVFIFSKVVYLQ